MTQAPEYRLVPVEATEAMICAGYENREGPTPYRAYQPSEVAAIYSDMLDAAPLPAAPAASTSAQGLPDSPLRIGNQVVYSAGHMVAHAIDALARSTDAPSEPKGEHYDEVKATLTALHAFVESLCSPAIYLRLGPAA